MTGRTPDLSLVAPIDGIMVPLEDLPDPVFSQKMMGDGISIDPTGQVLVELNADSEIALALMNERLAPRLPTVLMVASAKNVYLSSTFVRDTATLGGMIVPGSVSPAVEAALRQRFGAQLGGDGAPPAGSNKAASHQPID